MDPVRYNPSLPSGSSNSVKDVESQRGPVGYLRRRIKHLHWVMMASVGMLLFLGVLITGVLSFKNDVRNATRHSFTGGSPDSQTQVENGNATSNLFAKSFVTLSGFDPSGGVTYSLNYDSFANTDDPNVQLELPFACFFADDFNAGNIAEFFSVDPISSPGLQNVSGTMNASADGFLSRYPFDVYTVQLFVGVYASSVSPVGDMNCDLVTDFPPDDAQIPVPFQMAVQQNLDGFSATFKLEPQENRTDPNTYVLTLTVKRDGIIRFFAVVMFIVIWMLTIIVLIATGQVLLYHTEPRFDLVAASAALLFALPQIRSSQPGIPSTPTVSDTIGYYWTIALLGLSTFALIAHSIWQLRQERYLRRHPDAIQQIYLPRTGSDLSAMGEKSFFDEKDRRL